MIDWEIKRRSSSTATAPMAAPASSTLCRRMAIATPRRLRDRAKATTDDVKLDGLKWSASSRGLVQSTRAKARPFLSSTERATEAQRAALLSILSGENTEPGATILNVFAATFSEVHAAEFIADRRDHRCRGAYWRVTVKGFVGDAGRADPNPVTGAEHRARIDLPNGFEYTLAEMGSGSSKTSGPIALRSATRTASSPTSTSIIRAWCVP